MDVAPTNSDLKAQTEAAKKADANAQSANTNSTSDANSTSSAKAPDATSTKQASVSDSKAEAGAPEPASKSADTKSATDKDAQPQSDEASDDSNADAEPTPAKATAKQAPVRLEKTKAEKPKPAKTVDPSVALLAEGQRYLYGQGVRKSCEQALNLIHSAANQGNAEARSQLGGMYATGNCAPFDRVMAYRWFTLALAASPRNSTVQNTREMLWREMTDVERAHARSAAE
jgi:TPR repeat protein